MPATASPLRFALNHMAAPQLGLRDFLTLARRLGIGEVEIRNDIAGRAILDGTSADDVRSMAADAGVALLTINAQQRFNEWTSERAGEANALAAYAAQCGAQAIILVPVNGGAEQDDAERRDNLRIALSALKPILAGAGIGGLVEPLGFESSSLRSKREAVEAIRDVDGMGTFRLTHDTFHHYLGGEPELFADMTGLVHISGVVDRAVTAGEMRDAHRVFVDARDRIGNLEQIGALHRAGYAGPVSFEPFSEELGRLADPAQAIRASMEFIEAELAVQAA